MRWSLSWPKLSVGLLLLVALLLRLPFLSGSFWLDEAAQALESARPLAQQLSIQADFQPPLYHLIVHLLTQFSKAEWWLRLASLVPAIASVWLTYQVARHYLSHSGAWLAAATLAFSGIHIFFSQELRPYSLAVFWAVLSWYLYEKRQWRLFALSLAAGFYTSYVFVFWPFGFLAAALRQAKLRQTFASVSAAGLLFMAWWPQFLGQLAAGTQLRQTLPGWEEVVSLTQTKALLLTVTKFLVGVLTVDLVWLDLLLVGGSLALLLIGALLHFKRDRDKIVDFALLSGLPLLAAWLFSFVIPVVQPKRLLFLLPPLAIALGSIGASRRWLGRLSLALFFLWQGASLLGYWTNPNLQRENWRSAIGLIEERFSPENTVVVFGFDGPFAPWNWYSQEDFPIYATGLTPLLDYEQLPGKFIGIERFRYVIVFDYLRDLTDPYRLIEAHLNVAQYRELGIYTYPNLGQIRVFEQNQLYAGLEYEPS